MQRHNIDVYTQIGMQRLGQLYKNNNNIVNNNNNNKQTGDNGGAADGIDATIKTEQNFSNVQQIVESAIGWVRFHFLWLWDEN